MKLIGSKTRFRAGGAGAYFTEVSFRREGEEVDVGVANDDRHKALVDPSSRRARISCRGLVESTSNLNFCDIANPGAVVAVTDLTKIDQATLDFYAPWQVMNSDLSHRRRAASEDSMELVGTGGAIDANFDPDNFVATE